MTWTLILSALTVVAALNQHPPLAEDSSREPVAQSETRPPAWVVSMRAVGPITTTVPQHIAPGVGLAHNGAYRASVEYQPSKAGRLGMIRASLGLRALRRETWQVAIDVEHTQARPVRRLFQGSGWELQGHERHQLSLGAASIRWRERQVFGLVSGVEAGYGRMHIWRLVSARAGSDELSHSPDPVLESSAPVGMLGVSAARRLFFGLDAHARVRLIAAGRSRGGEVPFAHIATEWDVTREVFRSTTFGRGSFGLTGNHASSTRAASYFQNGLGFTFRVAF